MNRPRNPLIKPFFWREGILPSLAPSGALPPDCQRCAFGAWGRQSAFPPEESRLDQGFPKGLPEIRVSRRSRSAIYTDWAGCPAVERTPGKVSGAWVRRFSCSRAQEMRQAFWMPTPLDWTRLRHRRSRHAIARWATSRSKSSWKRIRGQTGCFPPLSSFPAISTVATGRALRRVGGQDALPPRPSLPRGAVQSDARIAGNRSTRYIGREIRR